MQWTSLDLKNMASILDDVADAVLAFRNQNAGNLTQLQKNQLTGQFGQLVSMGEQFENDALVKALIDIDGDVTDLQNATHDATDALQTIKNVQNAISIAVAVVGLGEAILNPSPGGIAQSVNTLVQAIQQAKNPPANAGPNGN